MTDKAPTFPTGFLVHDVSRIRKNVVDRKIKPLGITRSQWWVLVNIARYSNDDGIAQTELAQKMDMTKVSLGNLLDRMEQAGLLIRKTDPLDRRSRKVLISRSGAKILEQMKDISVKINKRIMRGIPKEQNELLDMILRKMKKNLLQMIDEP